MNVVCKKQCKLGKKVLLPGESCTAIYTENSAQVNIFIAGKKAAIIPAETFKETFKVGD